MPVPPSPGRLSGRSVSLEPLAPDHVADLVAAASEDRTTYGWTLVPSDERAMRAYVADLLDGASAGTVVPLVQRRAADGRLVGCTRYMDLRWWHGRDAPDEVEVGGTWLAASAQRGPINTEAKLLLFEHAFVVWGVQRVALATDARNERSRTAIERVGATFEGVLRRHRPSYVPGEEGRNRDTAVFAIRIDDWPAVRDRLTAMVTPG